MKKDNFRPQQRFSLRKYSFGLASVILGVSLFANEQTAQADENGGLAQPADPAVTTQDAGDPSSTVLETPVLASTAPAVQSEGHHISSELASSTLDVSVSVSETAPLSSSEAPSRFPASEASSESGVASPSTTSDQETRTNVATSEETVTTSPLRAVTLTNATAEISLAQANDADDPMPGDDQLTDTTQFGRGKDSDLGGTSLQLSPHLKAGNSLTAARLPQDLEAFDPKDNNKRVASLWSIRDAAGREDAYFASFVFDLSSQTYEMRIYDAAKQLITTESVGRQSGAKAKFLLAGNAAASIKEQAFVSLSYENNGYEALYNGTDGDTAHGRPADLSGVKRIYTTLMNPQVGTEYRPVGGGAQAYQSTGHFLPSGMTMTVNYLEEGTNRQVRPSNQLIGFIGDDYTTQAASEEELDVAFQDKGYELVTDRLPNETSGKIEGTFWGGKGFVYVRDLTRNGFTMRYRSTVINDDGDIVMEGWDKATGKKIPIRGYKTVYVDAGNGSYVLDRVRGNALSEYEYVSQPIKAAAYPNRSNAQWGAVAFHVTNGFDHLFTNSWKERMDNVTYWYRRPKGDVIVEYYLEGTDTKIAADQKVADQVAVKEAYDATDSSLRPSEITYNGKRYRLVETNGSPVLRNGSAPETGTVEKITQAVQYDYRLVQAKGSVAVTHLATDGTILKARELVQDGQPEGTAYTTNALSFPNYRLLGTSSDSAPTSGTVTADRTLEVIYTYERQKGNVTVTYQAEDGSVLEGPILVAQDAEAGSSYTTSPKSFAGYDVKELAPNSAPANGIVTGNTTLNVIYIYSPRVNPVPAVKPKGSVEVTYQTVDGTILEGPSIMAKDQEEGTTYTTSAKFFQGYQFKALATDSAPVSGTIVGNQILKVVYLYENVQERATSRGSVKVDYRDEDGNEIKASRLDVSEVPVGTSYNTNEEGENPSFIDKDGVRYRLLRHEGQEKGQVRQGETTVTYIYKALGQVIVEYLDENGQRLINPRVVAPWQEPGMDYDASYGNPRYIYRNGVKYEVERVVGQEKGKVGKGRTTITYIYRVVDEPEKIDESVRGGGSNQKTEEGQSLKPTAYKQKSLESTVDSLSLRPNDTKEGQGSSGTNEDNSLLPETGERPNKLQSIGAALLGLLLIVFGLFGRKKKDQ